MSTADTEFFTRDRVGRAMECFLFVCFSPVLLPAMGVLYLYDKMMARR